MSIKADRYVAELCDDRHEHLALGELQLNADGSHAFRIIESNWGAEYLKQHAKHAHPTGRGRYRKSVGICNVTICDAGDLPAAPHLHFKIEPPPKVSKFRTS